MQVLVANYPWATTPLGPMESWPTSLKTMVRFMLDSRYPMWMSWGPELTVLYNDAYARDTLSTKHPWALGKPARDVWREVWPVVESRVAGIFATGEATWDESLLLFLERNGYPEETYHTFSYSPLYDDHGKIAGHFCVVTEETERVIAQRRVAFLRDLGSALATCATRAEVYAAFSAHLTKYQHDVPFMSTFVRDNGAFHRVASSAATVSSPRDWPLVDVLARSEPLVFRTEHLTDLPMGPWLKPSAYAYLVPIVDRGETGAVIVAGLNPHRAFDDGYRGFLELLVGQVTSALAGAYAYEQERARAEALAELDRAKTTFFSNVSHELRTPLTLMLGPIEDLKRQARGAERDQLDIAHRNSVRLLKLVNSLLDFSRIEAGRLQAWFQPADLGAITADLASTFRSAVEKAGLTLDVDTQTTSRPAYIDPEMWEKIVLNLIANAFKYTMQGSIEVTVRQAGDNAELFVRDTGQGIPESELPNVFQRFYRVEGAHGRTHEGTGIGLALVSELVKLHGGAIRVESIEGAGTTFVVTLPLGFEHLPADRVQHSRSATVSSADVFLDEAMRWLPDAERERELEVDETPTVEAQRFAATRGSRILLADDNSDMRAYVARLLRPIWLVETVVDGEEALEAIRRNPPDLVLSDVMMPRLDGFELLQAMRVDPVLQNIPVILLSARAGEESRVEGMESGADDYLVKPFSARELLARVGAHLELARVRRDAHAALREVQRRSEAAMLAGEVGTYYWDIIGDRVYGDRNFVPIFGVLLDERSSAPLSEFIAAMHPDDRDRVSGLIRHTLMTDAPYEAEYRIVGGNRLRWVIARGVVDRGVHGDPVGWAGVVVDITERKRAEDKLLDVERSARVEAERVGRMKDEFLATLSHELRTPLNAILGWTQILRSRRTPASVDEGLNVIERNARLQAQLIEDLLDMSRIISGKITLDVQPVGLADIVAAAVDVVKPSADAKNVRIVQSLDTQPFQMSGDPNRLQQVLWNLLSNAVKFTPQGGHIQVVLERKAETVEISVSDNGQGISAEFLPHVFERFRQQDGTTARLHGGLGLGLAIVKQLVELHGGDILAKSEGTGRGATFVVRLPLVSTVARLPLPRAVRPVDEVRLDGLKALVVDDDRDARELLGHLLQDSGMQVAMACSAHEALSMLREELPDVLLSDIGMPVMDGYELIRRIRDLPALEGGRIPAVAITAFARPEDRSRVLMAGYQMHIAKPFEPDELRAVCASLTRR